MERLTERDEYGNTNIIDVDSGDLQLNLNFDEMNKVTDALNRLAAYEDTGLTPEQIEAQQQDIESLQRELNAEISVNEALAADKDEQARRIMQYDTVLRRAREALDSARGYTQYSADIRAKEAIESIDALLGGKEDA